MKKHIIIPVLLVLFIFSSCNQSENAKSMMIADESGSYDLSPAPAISEETVFRKNGNSGTLVTPLKLIKEGELGFETSDYSATRKKITDMASKYKGYVSKENEQSTNNRISNEIILRVPNESIDALMNDIASGAKRVDYKRMNLTDVTEEYVDLETRLKTKKEVEKRYVDILQQAKTITDILAVEEQLRVVREEIEASEGRLKFLSNRVDLSTLTISVYQELDYIYVPESQPSFFERALKSLDNGWRGLLEGLLGLLGAWPMLLFVVVLFFILNKLRKRRKAQKAARGSN